MPLSDDQIREQLLSLLLKPSHDPSVIQNLLRPLLEMMLAQFGTKDVVMAKLNVIFPIAAREYYQSLLRLDGTSSTLQTSFDMHRFEEGIRLQTEMILKTWIPIVSDILDQINLDQNMRAMSLERQRRKTLSPPEV